MKKLLALVLCVMMFVSVVPTSAFAGGYYVDYPVNTASQYNTQIKNMIKHTKTNVENAYKALVADEVVYSSAKTMDDTIVSLVNGIADPLIEKNKVNKAWADGVKDAMRSYFDSTVAKKIYDNYYKALDSDGNVDSLKYAQLIANSISDAMTDKDFVAGYRAVATYWALANVVSDIQDNLKDARDDFAKSVDNKFQKDFAEKYTNLVDDYIDTFATAAAKVANNELVDEVWDTLIAAAVLTRDTDIAAARTEYATSKKNGLEYLDGLREVQEETLDEANLTFAKAEAAYQKVMSDPKATAGEKEEAINTYKEAMNTHTQAVKDYNTEMKKLDGQEERFLEDIADIRDGKIFDAQWQYQFDYLDAEFEMDELGLGYEDINPWAMSSKAAGDWTDFTVLVGSPWD
jgi:hypothetical protein